MVGSVLTLLGVALQVLGLFVTAAGFWQTWHEFATEPFPPAQWVRVQVARGRAWFKRTILRRRSGIEVHVGSGSVSGAGSLHLRARVAWPPLTYSSVDDALAQLEARLNQLLNSISNADERLDDAIGELRTEIKGLRARMDEVVEETKARTNRVAVGGIVWASFGLALATAGLLLQGIAVFLG